MSKIVEKKALEEYPKSYVDENIGSREGYTKGYNQAMQDFIEKACEWLEKQFNMPNDFKQHFCKAMEE